MYKVFTILLAFRLQLSTGDDLQPGDIRNGPLYSVHRPQTSDVLDNATIDTFNRSYCVVIGKQTYCNVTQPWTPRISLFSAVVTVVLPVLYSVLMLTLLVLCQNNCHFGQQFRQIKVTFMANKNAIYFKNKYGKEVYERIEKMSREERHIEMIKMQPRSCRIKDFEEMEDEAQIEHLKSKRVHPNPELLTRKERRNHMKLAGTGENINAAMVKKYRYICKVKVPNCLRLSIMVTIVILAPIFKTVWDIVDVGADCYYFQKLETGELIDPNITRNERVNNTILAFAVLGALKSTVIALISLRLIEYSYGSRRDWVGMCAFLKRFTVWIKIMFEDGAELFLEYFYGDKFIVSQPPWWLIFKDSVTSLIYLAPLIHSFFSLQKQYDHVKRELGEVEARYIYLPCTVVHFLFCVITLLRVAGMTWQYVKADISPGCLAVSGTSGTLDQTPFSTDCLNTVDGLILMLGCIALLSALVSFCNFHRSRLMGKLVRSFVFRRNFVKSKLYRQLTHSTHSGSGSTHSHRNSERDNVNVNEVREVA